MIYEDYVSYETAEILKKKGFEQRPLFAKAENFNIEFFSLRPTISVVQKQMRIIH